MPLEVWEISNSLNIHIPLENSHFLFKSLCATKCNFKCLNTTLNLSFKSFRCSRKSAKDINLKTHLSSDNSW